MYTTLESFADTTGHDDILVLLDFWAHDYDWSRSYDANEGEGL